MYVRNGNVEMTVSEVGDEVLVFDPSTGHCHMLNSTASAVFQATDGQRGIGALAEVTGLPRPQVEQALAELTALGILSDVGVSRRSALKRGALVTGAVAATPMVLSLIAPQAAAAASGGSGGGGGTAPLASSGTVPAGTSLSGTAPAGATMLLITATGGAGFNAGVYDPAASPGAVIVTTLDLTSYAGQTFTLVGGGDADHSNNSYGNTSKAGGYPNGGTGGYNQAGGGGGSSSVTAASARLVVAGGGGGGDTDSGGFGYNFDAAANRTAGQVSQGGDGAPYVGDAATYGSGGGGGGPTPGAGGAGATQGDGFGNFYGSPGQDGSLTGQGGNGATNDQGSDSGRAGGGGGGYTGGGGGGGVAAGGAGSSYSVAAYTIQKAAGTGVSGITYSFS